MANYAINKIPIGPIDRESQTITVESLDSPIVSDRVVSMASTGVTPEKTITDARIGDKSAVYAQKTDTAAFSLGMVEQAISRAEEVDTIRDRITDVSLKSKTEQELEDYYIEQGLLVKGVDYTPTDIRYTTNTIIAEQLFRERLSKIEDETGTWGAIGDFIDRAFIRQIPIGWYEDLTRRSERKGEELLQAAVTMEPKEYRQYISNYIEELSKEGVFTSENIFALQQGLEEATNAGYDPMAGLLQVFAVVGAIETAEIGVKGLKAVGAAKGIKSIRGLTKADSTIGRIAAIEGQEAAAEAGEAIIKVTGTSDAETLAKMGPEAFDTGLSLRPQSAKTLEILEGNAIIRRVREAETKGVFGRIATTEQVDTLAARIAADYGKRTTNITNNYRVVRDILDNPIIEIDLGTTKIGTPYKSKAAAEKRLLASDLPEAKVVQVDPEDANKGYVIRAQKRMDISGLAEPVDLNAVEYGFIRDAYAGVFGSNAALDDEYLTALANMAEAGQTAMKKSTEDFQKKLTGLPLESRKAIVRTLKELREGKDASIHRGYTVEEFKDKFQEFHPTGAEATLRDTEAYEAIVQFEDAGWLLRANNALVRYVKKGYWSIDLGDGNKAIGRKVTDIPEDTEVFNLSSNTVEKASRIDIPIWELDIPLPNGATHISNPQSISILDHVDVLGFNAGGRRLNPKANYFIVLDDKDYPKAIITAFSERQAKQAVDQLNTIRQAISEGIEDIDSVIAKNNDWNPSINTLDELNELAAEKGWDLKKKISYKERDGIVVDETKSSVHHGSNWDSYVRHQLHRYDESLMDFGGAETYNVDPVSAILGEFGNAVSHYSHKAYTFNAAAAWVKRASQKGSGVKLSASYAPSDYLNQLQHAEITGNSASARDLRRLRDVIRRRLKMKGPVERRFEQFGKAASEFIFDTTKIKMNLKDPSSTLMTVGFQHAFGFFNVSQFFMQGLHSATIAAISPVHGVKAAGMVIPLRMIITSPTPEARALGIKRLAKFVGEEEITIKELVEFIETSGRDIVDNDLIELGTGPAYGISGWETDTFIPSKMKDVLDKTTMGGKKILDFGLTPFKTGERLSRMTGIGTAFFEFRKKYPGISPLSDQGRRWITTREQNLTFNMTSSSRAAFQSGVLALPTQWMSYTFRAMESIILGRGFTASERARLFTMLMPFYGLTGLGLESAADYFTEKFGVEDANLYLGMKYGVLDYLISEITPVETALATRLAPITGITDLYDKIVGGEASAIELAMGPSGEIISGTLESFWSTLQEVLNGNTVSMTKDTLAILRQPSGLDNIAKGLGILNNGLYRSKTGAIVPVEMKPSDALITFMGFSPAEVSEFYSRKGGQYTSGKKFRAFRKEMIRDFQYGLQVYRDNPETGRALLHAVHTKISLSGFSMAQQADIRRSLKDINTMKEIHYIQEDLIKQGKNLSATITQSILGGN